MMIFVLITTLLFLAAAQDTVTESSSSSEEPIPCSVGCTSLCFTNYTCSTCASGYDQDHTCLYCNNYDLLEDATQVSVMTGTGCQSRVRINDNGDIPEVVEEILKEDIYNYTFGADKPYRKPPCSPGDYVQGFWLKFDLSTLENDTLYIDFGVDSEVEDYDITIDIVSKHNNHKKCVGTSKIKSSKFLHFEMPKDMFMSDDSMFYFFFGIAQESTTTVSLNFTDKPTEYVTYYLGVENIVFLSEVKRTATAKIPMSSEGVFGYPACMPHIFGKMIDFFIEFNMSAVMLMSTKTENRIRYIEEYVLENDTKHCVHFYSPTTVNGKTAVFILLEQRYETRNFTIISQEHIHDIPLSFRYICPNNCFTNESHGYCSISQEACVCNDGYGGDDCHLLCYYQNQWQPSDNNGNDQCYYGTGNCDSYCQCAENYTLIGHDCISQNCSSGTYGEDIQCLYGSTFCQRNCTCQNGYIPSNVTHTCVLASCGNGIRDDTEDCDGGEYCDDKCHCISDKYEPSPNVPQSCQPKISSTTIGLISGFSVLLLLIVVVIILVLIIVKVSNSYVNINNEIYKTQQDLYYMYISGSKKFYPEQNTNQFDVFPLELDFGNRDTLTNIYETRFENVMLSNYSNKIMMVIFHTPNNPKYIFHFDPQIVFVSPKTRKVISVFMTLHCTTKIKDVCIPFTVWFSKQRKTLTAIEELLVGKTFDDWDQDSQYRMNVLLKGVTSHSHGNFVIMTDAASSTYLDMDELNMSDVPIAEGAMGKVFIGNYRSVPVAVKQFRWENLDEEEMNDLKKNVIQECEIMSKLRNPFIANYMGSVTYIPQVSLVLQFFVLGALGEYLRQEKTYYLKLPYKLKVRMLFDISRGMQFLHENRILHLDLKPDNLLVNSLYTDSACCIKITDFGTSRFTKTTQTNEKGLGTPVYVAPEGYNDVYTYAGDVYSFGITAWELFYQEEPFKEFKSLFDLKKSVLEGKRPKIDDRMPLKYRALVEDCWKQGFEERPSFSDVCDRIVKIGAEEVNVFKVDIGVDVNKVEDIIELKNERFNQIVKDL
ncbi:serine-threonine protein kinase, putative [Entamoeba invadens IP1]|uniref:serine-threonine protein kinase, putative n=1 Tax=Entamoeba invadens IP1 TaxID=370355 RepID=UPI0002C3DB2F|nr:serine-threonine protein kinase, putative [Entamoeba invadens IP1]ELP94000.1 serine-threonine protein kinase, putative [Entamoeba invadens IP1]|eukprot:XP_004260771.1 serine-threonine protein kinase, putative [Entamoeba invadens IP1]